MRNNLARSYASLPRLSVFAVSAMNAADQAGLRLEMAVGASKSWQSLTELPATISSMFWGTG